MKVVHKTEYQCDLGEVLDSTKLVEDAGYIPAKERIEEMIAAGQRLADYRKSRYDIPQGMEPSDEEIEALEDPTRSP